MSIKWNVTVFVIALIQTAFTFCFALDLSAHLKNQGWTCTERKYSETFSTNLCKGKLADYSETVRLYFRSGKKVAESQSINLFFHGFRLNSIATFHDDEKSKGLSGDFQTRIFESGSNGILIIPESKGKCETYEKNLASDSQITNFLNQIAKILSVKTYSINVGAHSGGGKTLNRFLNLDPVAKLVNGVYSFDSIHEQYQTGMTNYLKVNPLARIELVYVKPGTTHELTEVFLKSPVAQKAKARFQLHTEVTEANKELLENHFNTLKTFTFLDFLK